MMKMNAMMKIQYWQHGIALLILMLIVLLMATSLLLARLNKGDHQLIRQEQTMKALAQAKAALIGFAATYADDPDHKGQPQGYLPCPDIDGDGSSDAACSNRDKTVLGRFPWRTLGLPPLRDGSGECLWYVVSGTYKDAPKNILTSDTDGQLVVENLQTAINPNLNPPLAGPQNFEIIDDGVFPDGRKRCQFKRGVESASVMPDTRTQAIAIIFAPGQLVGSQSRVGGTSAQRTECGWTEAASVDGNQAYNYLDNQILAVDKNNNGLIDGSDCYVDFNNATATNTLEDRSLATGKFFDYRDDLITDLTNGISAANHPVVQSYFNSIFLSAPETKDANGQVIFNDVLSIITPKDFEPVYRRMNEWVAERVTQCIVNYASKNKSSFLSTHQAIIGDWQNPTAGTYRATYASKIEEYVLHSISNCKLAKCNTESGCKQVCTESEDECISECTDSACEQTCQSEKNSCTSGCANSVTSCELACDNNENTYRKNAIEVNSTYPWATTRVDATSSEDYADENGVRFGRVPLTLAQTLGTNQYMQAIWGTATNKSCTNPTNNICLDGKVCFDESAGLGDYEWGWWKKWKEMVFYAIDDSNAPAMGTHFWVKTQLGANKVANKWERDTTPNTYSKASTLAKINATAPNGWSNTVEPAAPAALKLNNDSATFAILVAGRKLSTQLDRDDKLNLDNYLELENKTTADDKFERKPLTPLFNDVACRNTRADCRNIPRGDNL